jgi:hypothetical protein
MLKSGRLPKEERNVWLFQVIQRKKVATTEGTVLSVPKSDAKG